jgi:hypothetical protein
MELLDIRYDSFEEILPLLDMEHKYRIKNEKMQDTLFIEPSLRENYYYLTIEKQSFLREGLMKPISKEYIERVAYHLGFRFDCCALEISISKKYNRNCWM